MKAGWRVVPLGEVLEVQNGFAFSSAQFAAGQGTPLIRIRDLKGGGSTEIGFVGSYDPAYLVRKGDLLIGMDGEFACYEWQGKEALLNQRVCRLKSFSDTLMPRFLLYGVNKYLKDIEDVTSFTTVKHLSSKTIKAIQFPLPPLGEQKWIVAVLDEAFEGLSRARANVEANLSDARGLFDSTLRGVFHSIERTAPKHTLAAVARTFGRGKSRHRPRNDPKLYGGNYPFVQTGDIRNSDGFVTAFSQTYNDFGLAQSKLWPEGTVCITIAANIAETAILGFPACFPDSIIGMVCDPEKVRAEYIELMLRYFAADLKEQGKGSAQDNINLATFEQSFFPIPGIAEQARIVEQLSEIAQERRNLEAHFIEVLKSLDTLRESLLQKAFSGELT